LYCIVKEEEDYNEIESIQFSVYNCTAHGARVAAQAQNYSHLLILCRIQKKTMLRIYNNNNNKPLYSFSGAYNNNVGARIYKIE
jgi:hypothetical protein